MRRVCCLLAILTAAALIGCQPPPTQPVPQTAHNSKDQNARTVSLVADANHPAVAKAPREDYSIEEYRLVNEKGEIVSVLRNGLVVITKRIPSPVLTVRGYAFTGGVYEGK